MIKRKEIIEFSEKLGVPAITIDKDYVLGHLVAGIFDNQFLEEHLIFKGGTCLRKCYFKNYRFSEDLDFTAVSLLNKNQLNLNFKNVIQKLESKYEILFGNYIIKDILYQNKLMGYQFSIPFWGANHSKNTQPNFSQSLPKIKIEITLHEIILFPRKHLSLIHLYSDILSDHIITCYSIEEIISEKLRSILQRHYCAPRDYYDLWYLMKNNDNIGWKNIMKAFKKKCEFKNISFYSINDFFDKKKLMNCKKQWKNSLGNHIKNLPKFDLAIDELKQIINKILCEN